jgi:hypothetical protein
MTTSPPPLDYQFSAPLEANDTYDIFVTVPRSKEILDTGKTVKLAGTIDGHAFQATLMPSGTGGHWLPLRLAIRKAIGKNQAGLTVDVHLTERFS